MRWAAAALALLLGLVLVARSLGRGLLGERQSVGEIAREPRRALDAAPAEVAERAKQILFGDLHVHTTFSTDAFMLSLPMNGGEGTRPPADACDFARFCSALDFWSINDHAEGLTPRQWRDTKASIRQCNEVAGGLDEPDLVSFLGWEWTQIGATPEDHYGHKNVVLRETADDQVPPRPISSRPGLFPPSSGARNFGPALRFAIIAASPRSDTRQPYHDMALFFQDRDDLLPCPAGVPTRDLPLDCQESATTPGDLFRRLDDWGFPHMVIPHGNTWGIYTPQGTSWDKQLAAHRDPVADEPILEVFSGHGNIEEYRPWRAFTRDEAGDKRCPEPGPGFEPECWRAGEIIRERCRAAGESEEECEGRSVEARQNHVDAGIAGHLTVPGAKPEDWLDSGQCSDCYMPAYHYRPGGSAQYALAIRNFDDPAHPKSFRFGFIGSSDSHTARPGTGYKERDRREMTDAGLSQAGPPRFSEIEPVAHSVAQPPGSPATPDFERFASFFGTAGLVATHATGRSREAIWSALERREVYATSGDRILLWFDLLTGPGAEGSPRPMGSEVRGPASPHFRVRAVGAPIQRGGCPPETLDALGAARIEHLCRSECYHPSDERRPIDRIEVVRIRPQIHPHEDPAALIEDPWRVLACAHDSEGCRVDFSDPDYAASGRDATYYVRAIQVATPAVNADNLRCERDAEDRCISTEPCYGDPRTDYQDDCLAPAEERAWSSPIFLVHGD